MNLLILSRISRKTQRKRQGPKLLHLNEVWVIKVLQDLIFWGDGALVGCSRFRGSFLVLGGP